ncbi:MAG: nitrite reductase small subunit NirD [Planctomycetes bacterium]|nr:nitrite reductase small subunit NirD [Planctomycetota bacterium]
MSLTCVAKLSELREGRGRVVSVGDKTIALFRRGDRVHAIDNTCPHVNGPLGEGDLEGDWVACPWHKWRFDITTGLCERHPSVSVACYPVAIDGDEISLEL